MPTMRTLAQAFDFFDGARAANPRWGWAAQSDDGRTVVLTMWRDQMGKDGRATTYHTGPSANVDAWSKRLGNRDRIRKLQHALDHCGGRFRAVIVEAVNPKASTRSTRNAYIADDRLIMRIETFDPITGEFTARSVETED